MLAPCGPRVPLPYSGAVPIPSVPRLRPPLPSPRVSREYAAVLQRYSETRSSARWGLVAQALAGAVRELLQVGALGGKRGCQLGSAPKRAENCRV